MDIDNLRTLQGNFKKIHEMTKKHPDLEEQLVDHRKCCPTSPHGVKICVIHKIRKFEPASLIIFK